jgi:hypothetical protein
VANVVGIPALDCILAVVGNSASAVVSGINKKRDYKNLFYQ